ncbi:MAG: phosphatase PAP2 family protein [Helcococcus sp.]|nr:phosphatase PAP2 family protein [Helcococcus sp.]
MMKIKKIVNEIKNDKITASIILLFALFSAITFEIFNRPWGKVTNLWIPLDDKIPFIKEFILIYHTFMPTIIVVGLLIFVLNKKEYKKLVISLFIAQILAYIIYMLFQTHVPRYDTNLLGNDFFSNLVRATYAIDNSYSGAPSLHVADMSLCIFYLLKTNEIKKSTKTFLTLYMILIALTTVLVKQHVVLDMPAGFIHAVICFFVTNFLYDRFIKKGR